MALRSFAKLSSVKLSAMKGLSTGSLRSQLIARPTNESQTQESLEAAQIMVPPAREPVTKAAPSLTDPYLTIEEAWAFCRVSEGKFNQIRKEVGLQPFTFYGKKLYRRADLELLVEREARKNYGESVKA